MKADAGQKSNGQDLFFSLKFDTIAGLESAEAVDETCSMTRPPLYLPAFREEKGNSKYYLGTLFF